MINIYTQTEIESLVKSGRILSSVLRAVAKKAKAGVTTKELDMEAERLIRAVGGVPSFLNYQEGKHKKFPASLCTSINDELVHCIPYEDRVLKDGDIISLDLGVRYEKMNTDMALTIAVGNVPKKIKKLIADTKESLDRGIGSIHPGNSVGDIGHAIQSFAESRGYGVIRDLVGHGVGREVHEEPQIPNFGKAGQGLKLKKGMVLAIEPMLSLGSRKLKFLEDGWGIATADGSLSAHFEKTVAVTENGYKIITP